ncbi:MAG: hypothetical protein M9942_11010 [Microthrixaceae bacterium]|nr:hypothetical protein [Microthrixaceae bacterium]MCO5318955.1 hypothetical protein [Microthrixaceae bacterium]
MSPLVFLGAALVISVIGTLVLWVRHRDTTGPDSTIDEFRSKMKALSDEPGSDAGRSGVSRRGG